MTFRTLATYLEKLEATSSRLEMTRILAELFGEANMEDGRLIAYLTQGKLGPKYSAPDFQLADKQVIKAVARITDKDVNVIYKEIGDLGLVVEKVKGDKDTQSKNINIKTVFDRLLEIAMVEGTGSQEDKIKKLSDLLMEIDALSAKYTVRIVLGKLRTGFSDMTVLDALSWMLTGGKSLREDIEKIYNVRADMGEVVKQVKNQSANIKDIKIDPIIGTPVLVARAERAKSPAEIWERNGVSAAEHKLDGLRLEAHVRESNITLFSRGLENVTSMYPDIVQGLTKQVHQDCILDGEMIAVDANGRYLPFQETAQRKRKYDILEMIKQVPLKYFTFDILSLNGKNMLDEGNDKRRETLEKVIQSGDVIKLMPRIIVASEKDIENYFYAALKEGTEGIVVKKLDGVYKSGSRDFNWIKYKKSYDESGEADTIDAVVMGYDAGEGKRSGFGIGGFLIGVYDKKEDKFKTIAKIGTGLTDEEWKELKTRCTQHEVGEKPENYEVSRQMKCDHWVQPVMVVEIKSDEISKSPAHTSGFALRFPRLVAFREMKVEEAATPVEIERLFILQRKEKNGGEET